jgi:hypothetical protein
LVSSAPKSVRHALAAEAMHSKHGPEVAAAGLSAAQAAKEARCLKEVDEWAASRGETLTEAERQRRLQHALKAADLRQVHLINKARAAKKAAPK